MNNRQIKSLIEITIKHFIDQSILPPTTYIDPEAYQKISKQLLLEEFENYVDYNRNLVDNTIKEIGGWEKVIKSKYQMPKKSITRMKRDIQSNLNSRKFEEYEDKYHQEANPDFEHLRKIKDNIISFYESRKNKIVNKNIEYLSSKFSNKELSFAISYDKPNAPDFPLMPIEKGLSNEDKKTLFKTISNTFRRYHNQY